MSRQRFSLDRLRALSYIGACALLAACPRPPGPLVPATPALEPVSGDSAAAWARTTLPRSPIVIRFRWRYQDERMRAAGRGSARIAPPDSLRFDYVGPLGLGSGAAVVIGDSVRWADPERQFRSLVPAIPMLWASLGIVQPPADAAVFARTESAAGGDTTRAVWRFVRGSDTLEYVATTGAVRRIDAEWRRAGDVVARSQTDLDAAARPTHARVLFPEAPARFELIVSVVDTAALIPPALWHRRR